MLKNKCYLCGKDATIQCKVCEIMYYCSEDCKQKDSASHSEHCSKELKKRIDALINSDNVIREFLKYLSKKFNPTKLGIVNATDGVFIENKKILAFIPKAKLENGVVVMKDFPIIVYMTTMFLNEYRLVPVEVKISKGEKFLVFDPSLCDQKFDCACLKKIPWIQKGQNIEMAFMASDKFVIQTETVVLTLCKFTALF